MSLTSQFLILVTAFRLAIIAAGMLSVMLNYKLFTRGIYLSGSEEGPLT